MLGEEVPVQPSAERLIEAMELHTQLIGLFDAPDPTAFEPLTEPEPGGRACCFAFYDEWMMGRTLHLTAETAGCGGARHWLFGERTRSRQEYIEFLVDTEGLKASHTLMGRWLDHHRPYHPEYPHLLLGPLRADQYRYLKTITFYVNPDQLSLLITGAHYHHAPGDPPAVLAPFGSGCMEMVTLFEDLGRPQAIIGATDIAMRQYIPGDLLAFTVTKPMYEALCELGPNSFLNKPFWARLKRARAAG
jgi:hypothetical protein